MIPSQWRAALRLAWRDALRCKGRTVLVVLLIAVPVLVLSAADVAYRTFQLDAPDVVARNLGAADVAVRKLGNDVQQTPTAWLGAYSVGFSDRAGQATAASTASVRAAVPGAVEVVERRQFAAIAGIRTPAGLQTTAVATFPYANPLVGGVVREQTGRPPRAPGEVALTAHLAGEVGATVGSTVHLITGQNWRVVGVVRDGSSRGSDAAYVGPGTLTGASDPQNTTWYVRTRHPITWHEVLRLNRAGWAVLSRAVLLDPPPASAVPVESGTTARDTYLGLLLIIGMALLEVVLLAGPAFAVGARRRQRDLALVAAVGATRSQLFRMVLADGVVAGTLAGAAGVALGVGAAAVGVPVLAPHVDRYPGAFEVRIPELLLLFAVGLITSVVAAVLPARRAARMDVVASLSGRRGQVRSSRLLPVGGILTAVVGAVVLAGRATGTNFGAYQIVAGMALVELGLLGCTPALLGGLGRLAGRAPLTVRMTLRDAARNRASAAPAVAAVMAAVIGAVAVTVGLSTVSADARRHYERSLPPDAVAVDLRGLPGVDAARIVSAVRRAVPGSAPAVVSEVDWCSRGRCGYPVQLDDRSPWFDRLVGPGTLPAVAAVTPSQVAAVLGRRDAAAALALGSGRPVLATPQQALAGRRVRAGLDISTATGERYVGTPDGYTALATGPVPSVLLTTDLVSRLGLHVAGAVVFARLGSPLQPAEEQALQLELFRINPSLFAQQDPGYRDRYAALSTAFLIGGAVVAVIAAVVATALAGVERRRDVQTLAAVGARPALRWRMSMVQAAVIAVLGTALGLGAGFIAPAAYVLAMNRASGPGGSGMRLDAPWTSLGALVVVVPLAAVLLAGLFGRGRLPAERARVFAG